MPAFFYCTCMGSRPPIAPVIRPVNSSSVTWNIYWLQNIDYLRRNLFSVELLLTSPSNFNFKQDSRMSSFMIWEELAVWTAPKHQTCFVNCTRTICFSLTSRETQRSVFTVPSSMMVSRIDWLPAGPALGGRPAFVSPLVFWKPRATMAKSSCGHIVSVELSLFQLQVEQDECMMVKSPYNLYRANDECCVLFLYLPP